MRILIIEDEKNTREFLVENLKAASFVVDSAEDGERGSYLARTNEYDLIILDHNLPRKSGMEVCKEIRNVGNETPIIVTTVRSELIHKINLLNCGADDYLTKPFSFEELLARIKAILRRPRQMVSNIMRIGDLILNPNNQTVTRKNKTIDLTSKEFALLEFLLRHKGTIVTRNMLMEHVWTTETDAFTNTVEMHIAKLRKKIETSVRKKLIHTIRNRGYLLDIK